MKKVLITIISLSLLGGHMVSAQTTDTSGSAGAPAQPSQRMVKPARATLNGACVATAVGVRDDALISAHNTRNTALTGALGIRKTEVQAAWNLADAKARRDARESAWKKFRSSAETARKTFRASADSAYKTFNAAVKACGVQGYTESSAQDTTQ